MTRDIQTVDDLFAAMNELVPTELCPPDVLPICDRIAGAAFFPGGSGLFVEDRDEQDIRFPIDGVMVLGHNFDSEAGFKESLIRGKERLTSPTWRSLIRLLNEAEVPLDQCFFTNAFMGLCSGESNRSYRGGDSYEFKSACLSFLKRQIYVQRPRLIVTLGLPAPSLLAQASLDLSHWKIRRQLRLIDLDEMPISVGVRFQFDAHSSHSADVVAIAHPSMKNAWRRTPKGFPSGGQGEIELIKTAWSGTVVTFAERWRR